MGKKMCAILEEIFFEMKKRPNHTCIVDHDGSRKTTNSVFLDLVSKIMGFLSAKSPSTDDFVVIRLKRGMEHIASMYACLAHGCPFTVIDVDYPDERAKAALDPYPKYTTIDEDTMEIINDATAHEINVNRIPDDAPGIVYYTSGSTGQPRGVLHNRRIFVRNHHFCGTIGILPEDVFLSVTDYMFAFSIWDWMLPMRYGITLHIGSSSMARDITLLRQYIQRHGITCSTLNPSVLRMIGAGSKLRTVIVAGEKPGLFTGLEGITIVNDYGCSECGSIAVGIIEDLSMEATLGSTYIGEELFLADASDEGKGEIALRCRGSMIRYVGKSDTCGKYTADRSTGMMILHTGDYGLKTDCGIINLGRMDGMVKINGQRVEPSEVEFRINEIEGVDNTVVKAFEEGGTHYLCCYYVGSVMPDEIRSILSSSVTPYMIPSFFERMEDLPRNARGKVDRASLKSLKPGSFHGRPPDNDVQERICRAFTEVLQIEGVGIDADFFQLGGDSLKAMKLQSLIGGISVAAIRKYRTPEAIAEHIGDDSNNVVLFDVETGCPLTGDQMTMYTDMVVNGKVSAYNLDFEMCIDATTEDVISALGRVIDAHPVLSTVIDDSTVPPRIIRGKRPEVIITDEVPAISIIKRPFDLSNGPIARFYVSGREDGTAIFACVNHLMFDGMSMTIFEKEVVHAIHGETLEVETDYIRIASEEHAKSGTDEWKLSEDYLDECFSDYDGNPVPPPVSNGKSGTEYRRLGIDRERLSAFASSLCVSPYNVMLSAFAYMMSRYTGEDDVFLCSVENGRDFGEFSRSFGMFAKTLPHRVDCKDSTVADFIRKVSSGFNETVSKGVYPFSSFAAKHGLKSDIVFQYRANLVPMPPRDNADGTEAKRASTNDILASVYDDGEGYVLEIDHSDKYSTAYVEGMGKTFDLVISGIIACNMLSDIRLTDEEDLCILDGINSKSGFEDHPDIIDAYRSSVWRHPDKPFVISGDVVCTYGRSLLLAGGIATSLSSEGIGRGDVVCMCVPRSVWTVIVPISIIRTGAAFVAVDPSYPDERISDIFCDCGARAIVTLSNLAGRFDGIFDGIILCADMIDDSDFTDVPVSGEDAAMIIYTSGTSGIPKGIVHTRRMLSHVSYGFIENQNIGEDSVIGLYTHIGYALHASVMYPAIVCGSKIDVIPEDCIKDISKLDCYLREHSVTHTAMTPSMVKEYLSFSNDVRMTSILMGGETVNIGTSGYDSILSVDYGTSETMSICTMRYSERKGRYDVGRPYRGYCVYVTDPEGRRLPPGTIGTLKTSGCHLSLGYTRPISPDTFTDNGFSKDPLHSRIYDTGDSARLTFDGIVEILGRKDGTIKINGNRVETDDVESAIYPIHGVKAVAVIEGRDKGFPNTLIAYVVADGLTEKDIRDGVAVRRPSYMVPSHVVFVTGLPRNQNGKIDRNRLPVPEIHSNEFVRPTNEMEATICEAFSKVLGREDIGIDDDFVSLGGDSLKAIMVQSAIGNIVSSSDIIRLRTPREIAKSHPIEECDIGDFSDVCPLNGSQYGVYLDIENRKEGTYYNNPLIVRMNDGIDVPRLVGAIRSLIDAHPVLRARVVVAERIGMAFDCEPEIETGPDESGFCRVFDVKKGPLARFRICEALGLFCLDVHHLIMDGVSTMILLNDISKAYGGGKLDIDKGIFRQIAYESRNTFHPSNIHSEIFSDVDVDAGLVPSVGRNESSLREIGMNVTMDDLRSASRRLGTTEGTLLMSCFGYALSRFTGRTDAVFTTFTHGRGHARLESAIGMFVRTVPIYVDCSDTDIGTFLKRSCNVIDALISNEMVSFMELSERFGFKLDVSFQYTGEIFNIAGDQFSIVGTMERDPISPLNLDVTFKNGALMVIAEHDETFSDELVTSMIHVFERILKTFIVSPPTVHLSEIEYVSADDIRREEAANDNKAELEFGNVLDAFRANLSSDPGHMLVSCSGRRYTYSDVDRITDGIAYAISQKGIRKGDTISVLVHRSEWYLISTLAVLKTGAAYVPIDDSLSDDRIAFMVEDSSSKSILVTPETLSRISSAGITCDAIDITRCIEHVFTEIDVDRRDSAVILYTSGTTGRPKGSVIPHLAIISFAEWYRSYLRPGPDDVHAMYVSFGFDVHIMSLYGPIVSGISVEIIPESVRYDMKALNDYFTSTGCSYTFLTTQIGKLFLSTVRKTSLKAMFIGGEKLGKVEPIEGMVAHNVCGPTESIVFVSSIPIEKRLVDNSVGWFNSNVGGYILDKERRRVPYGAVGELYLTGYQLSSSYLNRDDLNAASFVDNPFSEGHYGYEKMFASGDYARFLPDGSVEIIGRKDGQLKIRGNRVELTELDYAIGRIEGVSDVTVQAITNDLGGKELCAYVVRSDVRLSVESIRNQVARTLPPYMVPSFVVFLESIPLNINGKVDRRALPKPDASSLRKEYVAPRNDEERALCDSFEQLLEVGKVGIDDDFISLGGDSLIAIFVRRDCGFTTMADILRYRTPRLIAERASATVRFSYGYDDVCPLTNSQIAMIDSYGNSIDEMLRAVAKYTFSEDYDYDYVRLLTETLLSHHRSMSARIVHEGDGIVMRFDFVHDLDLKRCDPNEVFTNDYRDGHCFDVAICEWEGKIHLVTSSNHIMADAFSREAIVYDLESLLNGKECLDDNGILEQLTYEASLKDDDPNVMRSKELLEGMIDSSTVDYLNRCENETKGFSEKLITVDTKSIHDLIESNGITIDTFFTAVFASTLERITGKDACLFHYMQNGRGHLRSSNSVGLFARYIPISLRARDNGVIDNAKIAFSYFNELNYHDGYPTWLMFRDKNLQWDVRFQCMPEPVCNLGERVNIVYDMVDPVIPDGVVWVLVYMFSGRYCIYVQKSKTYSDDLIERILEEFDSVISDVVLKNNGEEAP